MKILEKSNLKAWEKSQKLGRKGVINLVKKKGLTGRGGACFSTGIKWGFAAKHKGEKYLICNADEGEPGTFKDKFIIKNNASTLIEGILIGCYAIECKQAFIYLRGEYSYLKNTLEKAIDEVVKKAKTNIKIDVVLGAGGYICGDETAIMQSIMGKRGEPYTKPPYPTDSGLWGKPTVINNVETLTNVPLLIINNDWSDEIRLFSVSGNVKKPGVYELKRTDRIKDVVKDNKIKTVYFGCAGGCMPICDSCFSKDDLVEHDCVLGSCSLIFVDESHSIVDVCTNIAKFFEFESCGKCSPCREGSMRVLNILQNISMGNAAKKDLKTLEELALFVKECSLCGLGQSSMNHLLNALKFFRREFSKKCK